MKNINFHEGYIESYYVKDMSQGIMVKYLYGIETLFKDEMLFFFKEYMNHHSIFVH